MSVLRITGTLAKPIYHLNNDLCDLPHEEIIKLDFAKVLLGKYTYDKEAFRQNIIHVNYCAITNIIFHSIELEIYPRKVHFINLFPNEYNNVIKLNEYIIGISLLFPIDLKDLPNLEFIFSFQNVQIEGFKPITQSSNFTSYMLIRNDKNYKNWEEFKRYLANSNITRSSL